MVSYSHKIPSERLVRCGLFLKEEEIITLFKDIKRCQIRTNQGGILLIYLRGNITNYVKIKIFIISILENISG